MLDRRFGEAAEPTGPAELEVHAFVEFLTQLFTALNTTLTRYAARCNRDKGSVSRYFSGQRIAPRDFVDELLRHVSEISGQPVTTEVQDQARRLRMEALRVRNASRHEVEQLRENLGSAERELHLASARERHLLRALEPLKRKLTRPSSATANWKLTGLPPATLPVWAPLSSSPIQG